MVTLELLREATRAKTRYAQSAWQLDLWRDMWHGAQEQREAVKPEVERLLSRFYSQVLQSWASDPQDANDLIRSIERGVDVKRYGRLLWETLMPYMRSSAYRGVLMARRAVRAAKNLAQSQYTFPMREANDSDWDIADEVLDYLFADDSELATLIVTVPSNMLEEIKDVIRSGFEAKKGAYDVASDLLVKIREAIPDFANYKADRIARTEMMRAYNHGAIEAYKRDGIEKFQWLAGPESDLYDCNCAGYAAETAEKPWSLKEVQIPPDHPNCVCCLAPVVVQREPEDIDF